MKFKQIFRWITIILVFSVWSLIFLLLVKVFPIFEEMFKEYNRKPPLLFNFIANISHFMQSWWSAVVFVVVFTLAGFRFWRQRKKAMEEGQTYRILEIKTSVYILALGIFILIFTYLVMFFSLLEIPELCAITR